MLKRGALERATCVTLGNTNHPFPAPQALLELAVCAHAVLQLQDSPSVNRCPPRQHTQHLFHLYATESGLYNLSASLRQKEKNKTRFARCTGIKGQVCCSKADTQQRKSKPGAMHLSAEPHSSPLFRISPLCAAPSPSAFAKVILLRGSQGNPLRCQDSAGCRIRIRERC